MDVSELSRRESRNSGRRGEARGTRGGQQIRFKKVRSQISFKIHPPPSASRLEKIRQICKSFMFEESGTATG
jgi:hypothetical protein